MRTAPLKWRIEQSRFTSTSERHAANTAALVAEAFRIPVALLRHHANEHRISHPRQIAMWLLVRSGYSLPDAAKAMGGFHHTTALYAVRKVQAAMNQDAELCSFLEDLHRKSCTRFDEGQNA